MPRPLGELPHSADALGTGGRRTNDRPKRPPTSSQRHRENMKRENRMERSAGSQARPRRSSFALQHTRTPQDARLFTQQAQPLPATAEGDSKTKRATRQAKDTSGQALSGRSVKTKNADHRQLQSEKAAGGTRHRSQLPGVVSEFKERVCIGNTPQHPIKPACYPSEARTSRTTRLFPFSVYSAI